MLLTIDTGNTHTVIGLWDAAPSAPKHTNSTSAKISPKPFTWQKICTWRLSTQKCCTADEIIVKVSTLISTKNLCADNIKAAMMCSVVPRLTANWSEALQTYLGIDVQLCTAKALGSAFACSYPYPHEIGMDYIADALGALHIYGAPVVVFDFGTATNISVVDERGIFKGGIIAPGVETGAAALFSKATQLTSVALRAPEHVVGQSTDECIRAGVVLGEAARVDGLVQMIFDELGYSAPVIATGGLSHVVGQYTKTITDVNADLTLQGLCVAFDEINATK